MAVAMNTVQPAVMTADDPIGQPVSQPGGQQGGLFGLIFAGLSGPAGQTQSVSANQSPDVKAEAKAGDDVKDAGGKSLEALMGQLALGVRTTVAGMPPESVAGESNITGTEAPVPATQDNGKSSPVKSPAFMLNKAAILLGRLIADISAGQNNPVTEPQLEEIRSAAGSLKQAVNDLAEQLQSVPANGENTEKEGTAEKSLKRISAKIDELMSLISMAGNTAPVQATSDPALAAVSGDPANESAQVGNMRQIVSSLQSVVEQCSTLMAGRQPEAAIQPVLQGSGPSGEKNVGMSAMNRITDFPAWKASNPSEGKQISSFSDMAKDITDAPAVMKTEDGKPSVVNAAVSVKAGELAGSLTAPVQEKDMQQATGAEGKITVPGKTVTSSSEPAAQGSSTSGEFSKEGREASYGLSESGKGNTVQTNVNMGMRSYDVTVQVHEQPQSAATELSRPVSHEQIMAQVREQLGANPSHGDVSRITLKLHPEDLGELKINMRMENQSLKVDIVAENQHVKDALMNNMDSLKETLSRQNISMDRFSVLTGGGSGNGDSYREWRQTAQNAAPNTYRQQYGFAEETAENSPGYLDSTENSLIDVRL